MDPRLDTKSAINEAVIREIERAGLFGNEKLDRQAITSALLDGPQDDHQRQQLRDFQTMVQIGHPDTELEQLDDPATPWDETPKPFGIAAQDLRKSMLSGYEGRGWAQSDVDRAGRMPQSRELSPGSRQFQEMERRRQLFNGLMESHEAKAGGGNYNYGMAPSGPMQTRSFTAGENKLTQQGNAAAEFNRTRDQKFGESGYMGQLENPEYAAGWAMNNFMNPLVDRFQYALHDGEGFMGSQQRRDEHIDALAASRAVSPLLPYSPEGYKAKDEAYHQVTGMADKIAPKTYDEYHRGKTGYYPSLAGSHGVSFLQNLIDATTFFAGTAIAKSAGSAAKAAGPLLRELAEEAPMYAGMVGGGYAASPEAVKQMPNWFESGNLARTDLYKQDEATGKARPETPKEFDTSMADKAAEKMNARHQLEEWQRNRPKAPYAKQ
jgi:hypothetical protein